MRASLAFCLAFSLSAGDEGPDAETQKRRWRERAVALAKKIENDVQRHSALALIDVETDIVEPGNLEAAVRLIGIARTPAHKRKLLGKLVRASKWKSAFSRTLTANEAKQIEEVFGANDRPGVTLLAMAYMDVRSDKVRVANALRLLESAPPGEWRDAVYFSAVHVLLARRHVASALRGGTLRLDIKKVPTSFVRLSEEAADRIDDTKLRDWAKAMLEMASMKRGRGEVDRAMTHVDRISLGDLRDILRFQAIAVLRTGKTSDEEAFAVRLSSQEVRLLTSHRD